MTSQTESVGSDGVTEQEIATLAQDLEALFSDGMTLQSDGSFVIDRQGIKERFGETEGAAIIAEFERVAHQQSRAASMVGLIHSTQDSYGECVLNYTGFGLIFGAAEGTILGYINSNQWKEAAETMVKFLGKQAVKGGAVGLAASLAAGGAWCATPWA